MLRPIFDALSPQDRQNASLLYIENKTGLRRRMLKPSPLIPRTYTFSVLKSSLHWCKSYFKSHFYSTGVCSDYGKKTLLFWFGISALSSCVINTCFVLFKRKEGPQQINSAFLTAQGKLIHRCLRVKSNNGKS